MVLVAFITVARCVAGLALDDWTVGGYVFGAPVCRGNYLYRVGVLVVVIVLTKFVVAF